MINLKRKEKKNVFNYNKNLLKISLKFLFYKHFVNV
jgi:hypothetical protein